MPDKSDKYHYPNQQAMTKGVTTREKFAAMAMAALIQSGERSDVAVADAAIQYADALIRRLDETESK